MLAAWLPGTSVPPLSTGRNPGRRGSAAPGPTSLAVLRVDRKASASRSRVWTSLARRGLQRPSVAQVATVTFGLGIGSSRKGTPDEGGEAAAPGSSVPAGLRRTMPSSITSSRQGGWALCWVNATMR